MEDPRAKVRLLLKRGCDEPSDPGDEIRRHVGRRCELVARNAAAIATMPSKWLCCRRGGFRCMSGVTNTLIAAAGKAATGDEAAAAEALTKALQDKQHHEAINNLVSDIENRRELLSKLTR